MARSVEPLDETFRLTDPGPWAAIDATDPWSSQEPKLLGGNWRGRDETREETGWHAGRLLAQVCLKGTAESIGQEKPLLRSWKKPGWGRRKESCELGELVTGSGRAVFGSYEVFLSWRASVTSSAPISRAFAPCSSLPSFPLSNLFNRSLLP